MSKLEILSSDRSGAEKGAKSKKSLAGVALFFGVALIALNTNLGDLVAKGLLTKIFHLLASIKGGIGVMFIVLFEMICSIFKYIADNFYSISICLGFIFAYWRIDDFMNEMRDDMKIIKKKAARKCSC